MNMKLDDILAGETLRTGKADHQRPVERRPVLGIDKPPQCRFARRRRFSACQRLDDAAHRRTRDADHRNARATARAGKGINRVKTASIPEFSLEKKHCDSLKDRNSAV